MNKLVYAMSFKERRGFQVEMWFSWVDGSKNTKTSEIGRPGNEQRKKTGVENCLIFPEYMRPDEGKFGEVDWNNQSKASNAKLFYSIDNGESLRIFELRNIRKRNLPI